MTNLSFDEPSGLETEITNLAKAKANKMNFTSQDILDLVEVIAGLRQQLAVARNKERLVSAQLGSYLRRAMIEVGAPWDFVAQTIDDFEQAQDDFDELVARTRHRLGLPNVDTNEIEAGERLADFAEGDGGTAGADGGSELHGGGTANDLEDFKREVGEMLGVDPSKIQVIEFSGQGAISPKELEQLVSSLGVPAGRPATAEQVEHGPRPVAQQRHEDPADEILRRLLGR